MLCLRELIGFGVRPPPPPPPYVPPLDFRPAIGIGGTMLFLSSYSGAALRVRNPDSAVETDIGFANGMLSDAEVAAAQGASASLTVPKVYRQDGGSNHYEQATVAKQPRLVKADGLWALEFDYLAGASGMSLRATLALTQPHTRYMILRPRAWNATGYYADGRNVADGDVAVFIQNSVSPQARIYAGGYVPGTVDFPMLTWSIATNVYNGATSELRRNKLTALTGDAGSGTNISSQTIASRAGGSGTDSASVHVCGIFNYLAADNTAAQDAVIDALSDATGISV